LTLLAGDEGYDLSTMVGEAIEESPTLKALTSKTESVSGTVDVMMAIMESKIGGVDEPIVIEQIQ
jgi:hypothetical protein